MSWQFIHSHTLHIQLFSYSRTYHQIADKTNGLCVFFFFFISAWCQCHFADKCRQEETLCAQNFQNFYHITGNGLTIDISQNPWPYLIDSHRWCHSRQCLPINISIADTYSNDALRIWSIPNNPLEPLMITPYQCTYILVKCSLNDKRKSKKNYHLTQHVLVGG